jgi:hypothetical protein
MNDPHTGGGDFYAHGGSGRPVFNPGNTSPFQIARTEAVPKRVARNPLKTIVAWAVFLVVVAIAAKYGYPLVMDKVHAKEISAVTADLENVAAGEESYKRLYGAYGTDFTSLSVPKTVNDITVVSAGSSAYCLKGESVTGGVTLYFTPAAGVSDKPCA